MPRFYENVISEFGKEREWVYYKHLYCVFKVMCKLDYKNNKFIHKPTFTYIKAMQLLELVDVDECELC